MKSELGIREPKAIRRIIQIMEDKGIGGQRLTGGSLLWNEQARTISEIGYLNYMEQIQKEKNEIKEHEQSIKEKDNVLLLLSRYQFRIRWLPIIAIVISFFAFILSICALFIKK